MLMIVTTICAAAVCPHSKQVLPFKTNITELKFDQFVFQCHIFKIEMEKELLKYHKTHNNCRSIQKKIVNKSSALIAEDNKTLEGDLVNLENILNQHATNYHELTKAFQEYISTKKPEIPAHLEKTYKQAVNVDIVLTQNEANQTVKCKGYRSQIALLKKTNEETRTKTLKKYQKYLRRFNEDLTEFRKKYGLLVTNMY